MMERLVLLFYKILNPFEANANRFGPSVGKSVLITRTSDAHFLFKITQTLECYYVLLHYIERLRITQIYYIIKKL